MGAFSVFLRCLCGAGPLLDLPLSVDDGTGYPFYLIDIKRFSQVAIDSVLMGLLFIETLRQRSYNHHLGGNIVAHESISGPLCH